MWASNEVKVETTTPNIVIKIEQKDNERRNEMEHKGFPPLVIEAELQDRKRDRTGKTVKSKSQSKTETKAKRVGAASGKVASVGKGKGKTKSDKTSSNVEPAFEHCLTIIASRSRLRETQNDASGSSGNNQTSHTRERLAVLFGRERGLGVVAVTELAKLLLQNQAAQQQSRTYCDTTNAATVGNVAATPRTTNSGAVATATLSSSVRVPNNALSGIIVVTGHGFTSFAQGPLNKLAERYGVSLRTFLHELLLTDKTTHVLVKPHIKLNPAEVDELLQRYKIQSQPQQLPKLYRTDRIAQHFNFQLGDVVKIVNVAAPPDFRIVVDRPV